MDPVEQLDKMQDEKCAPVNGVRLNEYEKPFTQSEVHYVLTAANLTERCAACRFFKHKNSYDPCLLVVNDAPLPIVEGGTCDWFEPIEVREPDPMPVEIVGVIELVEDDYSDRAGYGDPKKKPPKKPKKKPSGKDDMDDDKDDEEKDDEEKFLVTAEQLARLPDLLRKLYQPTGLREETIPTLLSDAFLEPSGFKLIRSADKVSWLGWYSNNFKDKESDIFAEKGFDYYNDKVSDGGWPLPELWCMHQKYLKHGKALKTFRVGHFQIAVGIFDDPKENPLVPTFIKYYDEHKVTMSHGFFYDRKDYVNRVFLKFRTFEVSTIKPGREANNHYTGLELRDAEG